MKCASVKKNVANINRFRSNQKLSLTNRNRSTTLLSHNRAHSIQQPLKTILLCSSIPGSNTLLRAEASASAPHHQVRQPPPGDTALGRFWMERAPGEVDFDLTWLPIAFGQMLLAARKNARTSSMWWENCYLLVVSILLHYLSLAKSKHTGSLLSCKLMSSADSASSTS